MMATYRIETTGGSYEIETADAPTPKAAPPDVFEKAVNYRTGNALIDAPLGLVQGVAKGAASTGVGIGSLARKVAGRPPLPADTYKADTEATNNWQGVGKFAEQTVEFAVPGSAAGKAAKGLGLLGRTVAQGTTAGAVGAAQSGGDPLATGASAVLGGAGELAGPAFRQVRKLVTNRAPTLANFADSFKATPTQKAKISSALGTLKADGIQPSGDIHEMQDAIKGQVQKLSDAYQAVDPAVRAREIPASDVIGALRKHQGAYMQRGVVLDDSAYNAIESQIQKVQAMGAQNRGKVDVNDLIKLKQTANNKTGFASADWENEVWGKVGSTYRRVANQAAPELKPLNESWQKYAQLEKEIDKNVSQGKGTTKSGLDFLGEHLSARHVGAGVGAMVGGAPGAIVGSMVAPKVARTAQQMLQNAIDSGSFQSLTKASQNIAAYAASKNDTKTLLRVLSSGAQKETVRRAATSSP
jgi:hypothetical protein